MKTFNALLVAACALLLVQAVVADPECSEGDTRKEDCNSCFCTSNGYWACTLMACPRERRDVVDPATRGTECRDGYRKKEECNTCFCQNGYWACTKKGCQSHLNKRDAPECSRGDRKQEDCNSCKCFKGRWACTRKFCIKEKREVSTKVLADLKNVPCTPNDSFLIDCNRCQCNFERTGYTCTRLDCLQKRSLPS